MARFLMSVWLTPGHMYPAIAVGRELLAQGHAVAFHTAASYAELLEPLGFALCPLRGSPGADGGDVALRDEPAGAAAMKATFRRRFVDKVPDDVTSLRAAVGEWSPDVLINDPVSFAALIVGELDDLPVATLNNVVFSWPGDDFGPFGPGLPPARDGATRSEYAGLRARAAAYFADVVADLNAMRVGYGLAPRSGPLPLATLSPYLQMIPTILALDYDRQDLPPQVHHVGPCLFDPPAALDAATEAWIAALHPDTPLVLVAASSVFTRSAGLVETALAALGAMGCAVLATLPFDHVLLDAPVPAHTHVARFVPHSHVLPRAAAVVTHGGFGMVTKALSYGVPPVVVPYAADQPEMAQRVAEAGAGVRLDPAALTPDALREAVAATLHEPRYRDTAQRLAAEMARHNGPAEATELLARLAATRRPILRPARMPLLSPDLREGVSPSPASSSAAADTAPAGGGE